MIYNRISRLFVCEIYSTSVAYLCVIDFANINWIHTILAYMYICIHTEKREREREKSKYHRVACPEQNAFSLITSKSEARIINPVRSVTTELQL